MIGRATLSVLLAAALFAGFAARATGDSAGDEAAARRLAAAIRIETFARESDEAAESAVWSDFHGHLEDGFPRVHRTLTRETVLNRSLLYTWKGRDPAARPILLMAHMDVVPARRGDGWDQAPFGGVIEDGVIWGRGALDDKLSVLGILEAAERLLGDGFSPGRDVYLAFGHDEEVAGHGAKAIARLLAKRGVRLEFVLDEGSVINQGLVPGVEPPVAMIGLTEKGYLSVKLTATSRGGQAGHSSMPPPGTPVERLARALARLADQPMASEIRPPVSNMLDVLAPEMPFWQRLAMQNRWLTDPLVRSKLSGFPAGNAMIRTTGVATVIKAGSEENVIPQKAEATVNYRILPGDSVERVLGHVEAIVSDLGIEVAHDAEFPPPPVADPGSASYALLEGSVRKIFPEALVAPALVIAGTDSRVYSEPDTAIADNVYRFLPVSLSEEQLGTIHGVNERLSVAAYAAVIAFYEELLRQAAP